MASPTLTSSPLPEGEGDRLKSKKLFCFLWRFREVKALNRFQMDPSRLAAAASLIMASAMTSRWI